MKQEVSKTNTTSKSRWLELDKVAKSDLVSRLSSLSHRGLPGRRICGQRHLLSSQPGETRLLSPGAHPGPPRATTRLIPAMRTTAPPERGPDEFAGPFAAEFEVAVGSVGVTTLPKSAPSLSR